MTTKLEPDQKRLITRAQKLGREIERFRVFGYVTRGIENLEADDKRLWRAIDKLDDSARRVRLLQDPGWQLLKKSLVDEMRRARQTALDIRAAMYRSQADALRSTPKKDGPLDSFMQDWELSETKRKAKLRK